MNNVKIEVSVKVTHYNKATYQMAPLFVAEHKVEKDDIDCTEVRSRVRDLVTAIRQEALNELGAIVESEKEAAEQARTEAEKAAA
jgi:hypothetical protein